MFTEVRFDEAASAFSVSLFPEVENPFDPTDLSVDCEPPYLSFQAQGVRNSQGVRCYLLMDEHDARHSKGSVAVPGEVIAETVWTTAEWYYLTESGKIFQSSFPHLELRQLFTNTLNPTGQLDWKAIVPIGANLGVQAVSEDGQELLISTFHIHDAPESGVANTWSNTELSEYCYNLNTDGSMERRECSPTTYNMELQPFDLGALEPHSKEIVDVQIGSNHVLALLRDGSVFGWGSSEFGQLGVLGVEETEVPIPIGLDSDVTVMIGDVEVPATVDPTGNVTVVLPPNEPGTFPIQVDWNGQQIDLGNHTYHASIETTIDTTAAVDIADSGQQWVEGYLTLVIPEEQRQYSTGRPLVVVADTWQVAPIKADGASGSSAVDPAEFGPTTEVNFDEQGTARIRVLGQDGSRGSLAVIGPSTHADKVVFEPQDGLTLLLPPESGGTAPALLIVGAIATLGILAGIAFLVRRKRNRDAEPA